MYANQKGFSKAEGDLVFRLSDLIAEENGFTFRDLNKNGRLDV